MKGLKNTIIGILLIGALIYIFPRTVQAIGGATNTSYVSETFTPVNGSIDATAGNVYTFNLTTTDKTYRWVGLWGNVTGDIQLKASTNSFYTWSLGSITADSVIYATTDATGVDPTDFTLTNNTYLLQSDTAYGYAADVTDRIENTYTTSATFQSPSMQTGVVVNTTLVGSTWTNYLIRKVAGSSPITTTDDIVWAVEINPQQTAFNSQKADYELLLPENEEVGDGEGAVTTYYLWIEIK